MGKSARSADGDNPKESPAIKILLTLIGTAATVLVGYWQFGPPSKPTPPSVGRKITGRVVDAVNNRAVAHAKVAMDSEDLPPVQYTDSEGVFTFPMPSSAQYVHLRVEASGYEPADRRVNPAALGEIEEIRLQPARPDAPPSPRPAAEPVAELSRDFVLGRWQVEQSSGPFSAGTVIDYRDDGTFSGSVTQFVNGMGQKVPVEGEWSFEKLSSNTFRLKVAASDGSARSGEFRVIDRGHIHNTQENYIAVRLE
jgi:hypothetical protein